MGSLRINRTSAQQTVSDVLPGSPAARAGVRRGDTLVSINGEPVVDLVDYEYLTANAFLTLSLTDSDGASRTVTLEKDDCEPLGLSFATSMMDGLRTCKNRCVFCFIDQMRPGVRTSLHVKDDDWRMSFVMGNYVSLTNVDDAELDRIIRRRVSPLYVSLHATDPAVRTEMMRNPNAGRVMEQLQKLKAAGLRFHLQIVLCPGLNDGAVLEQTLSDVETLLPAAQSLAIVPVGLTRFRDNLYPLRCWTVEEAVRMAEWIRPVQERYLAAYGTRFAFLSDEWYTMCGKPLPPYEAYEDFVQIENGVGLLRLFERDFLDALALQAPLPEKKRFFAASGVSAAPFMTELVKSLLPYGIELTVVPVTNRYFGEHVTVSGLVTGQDLVATLRGSCVGAPLLLPRAMLREQEDVFLDNMTLSEAEQALRSTILPFRDGEECIEKLFGSMVL